MNTCLSFCNQKLTKNRPKVYFFYCFLLGQQANKPNGHDEE